MKHLQGHIIEAANQWFILKKDEDPVSNNEANVIVFGCCGVGEEITSTGHEFLTFANEDGLETALDTYVGQANYYKDSVENASNKFQGISSKYENETPLPDIED